MTRANTVKKSIDLPEDDVEWFESTYPKGSFSWILGMLLHEFRVATTAKPEDYARLGAEALKEMLEAERQPT